MATFPCNDMTAEPMQIDEQTIMAMAICCIAEETGIDPAELKIVSFRELKKSSLDQYIEQNHIIYKKYSIGDELR